jgi:hypothetical protein
MGGTVLGAFAYSQKVPVTFILSIRLYAFISRAPTGQICMKFDIGYFGDFMKICWENPNLVSLAKISDTLHKDVSTYLL